MDWPTKDEYDFAFNNLPINLKDPTIQGQLARNKFGQIATFGGANLYVCMYKVGETMIRCFCSNDSYDPPDDILDRYRAIDEFSHANLSLASALLPVTFNKQEQGIQVGKRLLPLVKTPFIENAIPLGDFIKDHHQERPVMQQLSQSWWRMISEFDGIFFAHGDLDLTNILVKKDTWPPILKAIDYDNVWIPDLNGFEQTEHGHPHFQHPAVMPPESSPDGSLTVRFTDAGNRPYDDKMDRFSALVIYLSLQVLIYRPQLYEEWGADEDTRLILSQRDYLTVDHPENRIVQLQTWCKNDSLPKSLLPYVNELLLSLSRIKSLWTPRPLDEIARSPRELLVGADQGEGLPPIADWSQLISNPDAVYATKEKHPDMTTVIEQSSVQNPIYVKEKVGMRPTFIPDTQDYWSSKPSRYPEIPIWALVGAGIICIILVLTILVLVFSR